MDLKRPQNSDIFELDSAKEDSQGPYELESNLSSVSLISDNNQDEFEDRDDHTPVNNLKNFSDHNANLELQLYDKTEIGNEKKDNTTNNVHFNSTGDAYADVDEEADDVETADLVGLEPKLRDAWIKMRKLDKKLAGLLKLEKKTRLETKALIEKNKADLEQLRLTSNHVESKLEAQNTAKFLSLTYVNIEEEENETTEHPIDHDELHTPLFKTQLSYNDDANQCNEDASNRANNLARNNFNQAPSSTKDKSKKSESIYTTTKSNFKSQSNSSQAESKTASHKSGKESEKNFIKRNIKLVQDTGGVYAMTPEEKIRLNELMADIEESENSANGNEPKQILDTFVGENNNLTYLVNYDPSLVAIDQGEGFTPNRDEAERLKQIDTIIDTKIVSRLNARSLNQFSDSNSILQDPSSNMKMLDSNSHIGVSENGGVRQIKLNDDFDENEFGDKFIREARITREQEIRLKYIDSNLQKMSSLSHARFGTSKASDSNYDFDQNEINDSYRVESVNEDQIKQLIEEYYTEAALSEKGQNAIESNSEIDSVPNRPVPTLSENQLKSLLIEAGVNEEFYKQESTEPDHSYYEEAVRILSARKLPFSYANNQLTDDQVVADGPSQTYMENGNERNSLDLGQSTHENDMMVATDSREFDNKTPILPNLPQEKATNRSIEDSHRLSFSSRRSSSASSLILPKIDERFLPRSDSSTSKH